MFRFLEGIQMTTQPPSQNDNKSYDCDLCDSGDWLSETEVEIHKRTVHMKDLCKRLSLEHVCLTCSQQHDSKEELIAHIKTVHLLSSAGARRVEREIFICDYCYDMFFNKDMLAAHIGHKHRNKVILQCPKCPRRLKPLLMYRHVSARHQFQSVSLCPVCLTKRRDRAELARHVAAHRKHYHCGVCGYMSTKEREFNLHLDTCAARRAGAAQARFRQCFAPAAGAAQARFRQCFAPAAGAAQARFRQCFAPAAGAARRTFLRSRPALTGLVLPAPLHLCVLCRELCEPADMRDHVARTHSAPAAESRAAYTCACGEQFANRIMLKHHVFKLRGDHREAQSTTAELSASQPPGEAPSGAGADTQPDVLVSNEDNITTAAAEEDADERYLVIVAEEDQPPTMDFQVTFESDDETRTSQEDTTEPPPTSDS